MSPRPRLEGSSSLNIDGMAGAAEAAVRCLGIGSEDDVLVLCNEEQRAIAEALVAAAQGPGRSTRIVVFETLSRDGEEPPADVAAAMGEADVVIAPTTFSLSHTRARMHATSRGARIATMPGITDAVFARAMPVDYVELRQAGERIAAALGCASICRVTSAAGTDIVLSLEGRAAEVDHGNLQATPAFGNLPAGEAYIAPVEDSAEGLVVFDGSLAGYGLLDDPVRVKVAGGRVVEADGEAGRWLLSTLDAGGARGRALAELGIGTNPAATLSGNILEDEKVIGTAHLAFGTNLSFGGANASTVHIDGMLLEPTVELDERPLMRDGELLASKDYPDPQSTHPSPS
jgi:leucyl aminopeptidase (aminopeptidase T)